MEAERAKLRDMPDVGKIRSRVRQTRKGPETYFYIDFYPHLKGAERRLYGVMGSKFCSEEDAENTRRRICHDSARLGLADAAAQFRQPRARRNLVLTHVEEWMLEAELAPFTRDRYRSAIRRHYDFWAIRGIREVTTAAVREWIRELRAAGLSNASIRTTLLPLRGAVRLYRESHPELPAIVWPQIKVVRVKRERMLLEDILAVLDQIREESRGIFLCGFYTMCRPNEARALLIEDYDWKAGTLDIRRALKTMSGARPAQGDTKTGRGGVYPLPAELRAWLVKWRGDARLDRSAPLFPCKDGHAWGHDSLWSMWRRACGRADVPYVTLYRALKHSAGTALLENGLSREDLQAAYRHRAASMTEVYELDDTQRRERASKHLENLVGDKRETRQMAAESDSPSPQTIEEAK